MKLKSGLSKTAIRNLVVRYAPDGVAVNSLKNCYFHRHRDYYTLSWGFYSVNVFFMFGAVRICYFYESKKITTVLADVDYLIDHKLCA